jgi:LmbE family N-acetylglucosaminyl deacetylase
MSIQRVLLAVFAHPDDESFGPGGTLGRYAAEGVQVHYLCATRGDVVPVITFTRVYPALGPGIERDLFADI